MVTDLPDDLKKARSILDKFIISDWFSLSDYHSKLKIIKRVENALNVFDNHLNKFPESPNQKISNIKLSFAKGLIEQLKDENNPTFLDWLEIILLLSKLKPEIEQMKEIYPSIYENYIAFKSLYIIELKNAMGTFA